MSKLTNWPWLESNSYRLDSGLQLLVLADALTIWASQTAILEVDVVCDVAMIATPNVLTTKSPDLLYNQCIDNTLLFVFYLSHGLDKGM